MQSNKEYSVKPALRLLAYDTAVFAGCATALYTKKKYFAGRAMGFEMVGEVVTVFAGVIFISSVFNVHDKLRPKN